MSTANNTTDETRYSSPYERALLAIALKDLNSLIEIRQKITSDCFLYLPNKIIFISLCLLVDDTNVNRVDLDSLWIECASKGLEDCGVGVEYLALLSQVDHNNANISFYLDKVINAYKKYNLSRCLKSNLALVEKNALDEEETLRGEDLIGKVSTDLIKLNLTSNALDEEAIVIADRVEDYVLERAAGVVEISGLRTGIYGLDLALNGLLPGTLTIIAGKAKAGKSTVLMNIADYVAIESPTPTPVLIISTEMYSDEDISRLVAMRSQVLERNIATGQAYNNPEEKILIDAAIHQIKQAKIYHKYMPDFNADSICNLITYFKHKYNIGLAIFDYIKMETVRSAGILDKRREDQILGDVANALKMSAGKLNIPVLTACQVNTRTNSVADSDRLIRYCNFLVEFYNKTPEELQQQSPIEEYGTHWLHVTYGRSGSNKRIPITFYKPCNKILEAKKFTEAEVETSQDSSNNLTTPREVEKQRTEKFREAYQQYDSGTTVLDILEKSTTSNIDGDDLF